MDKPGLTIIVPVYMEAENIESAVKGINLAVGKSGIEDYEILIIDCNRPDGSNDGTPEIADGLALRDAHRIKTFHNSYINLGKKYWMGVDNASFPFVIMIPGDNELSSESIERVLSQIGEKDIIISYPSNQEIRPFSRRIISRTFTMLMNFITGLNLKYYNGMCIHRVDILKKLKHRNTSFAYMAEILSSVLKEGCSYKEVPILLQEKKGGKSAAFKIDNIIDVGKTLLRLFWRYRIRSFLKK